MSKLKVLCEMYANTEEAIHTREALLENLGGQIQEIVSTLGPKLSSELAGIGVTLPRSLTTRRQRVSKDAAVRLSGHMRDKASVARNFTRPELVAAVQVDYPDVSAHILNRLFDGLSFTPAGVREDLRGRPIVYSV